MLLGNVGRIVGGVPAFDDADPTTAARGGRHDRGRRAAVGAHARPAGVRPLGRSRFVRITRGRKVSVRLDGPLPYELDGGARGTTKKFKAAIAPGAVTVRVPRSPKLRG